MEIRREAGQERPHRRASGRLAEHSWSEENLKQLETPQKPKSTTVDIPPATELLDPPPAAPDAPEDEMEEPTAETEENEEMQGEPSDTKTTPGASSSAKGEKRTETQENVF